MAVTFTPRILIKSCYAGSRLQCYFGQLPGGSEKSCGGTTTTSKEKAIETYRRTLRLRGIRCDDDIPVEIEDTPGDVLVPV